MDNKNTKKANLRQMIIEAAKIYSKDLAGKTFLYVYGHEFFELSFLTNCFHHLTGVDTCLSAKEFYRKSKQGIIAFNQIFFSQNHPFETAKKKLPCLKRLPELTNSCVCVLKNQSTLTVTYKLSITNLDFTLGLTENFDKKGRKVNDLFIPRTLRVKDRSVEQSSDGEFVDFIFMKDASVNLYQKLLYADSKKQIPNDIYDLIDKSFISGD